MKLIFKTLFFLAILLGFFSSSLYALSEFYCLFNSCGTNLIAEVVVSALAALFFFWVLLECIKKNKGDRPIDSYVTPGDEVFFYMGMDLVIIIGIMSFGKTFFPELHTEFVKKFNEVFATWYIRFPTYAIFLFSFTVTRLVLLGITIKSSSTDEADEKNDD